MGRKRRSDAHTLDLSLRITTETRLKGLIQGGASLTARFVRVPAALGGDQPTYVLVINDAGRKNVLAVTRSERGVKIFPYAPSVLTFVKRFPEIEFAPLDITPEDKVSFEELKEIAQGREGH